MHMWLYTHEHVHIHAHVSACVPTCTCTCTLCVCTFVESCLATEILKAYNYLEAELMEEVMGSLGWIGSQPPTKELHDPNWDAFAHAAHNYN